MHLSTEHSISAQLSNERGIALITSLLITLLLTLVVVALSYRVGLFSMGTRDHVVKSQSLYTAEIGLNQARYFLMANDCLPPNFNACEGLKGITSTFTKISSSSISKVFNTAIPEFTIGGEKYTVDLTGGNLTHGTSDSYKFETYVKTTNIPKVINVMAVSSRTDTQTQTVIDAGLIYTKPIGSDYKQLGQGGSREGMAGESLGADSGTVRTNF